MKKGISLIIALIIGSITIVSAQQQKQSRQQQGKQKIAEVKAELDLNEKQSAEWDRIHNDFMNDMMALRKDESISDEDKRAKAKVIKEEKDKSLKSVLDSDQYDRYIEYGNQARKQYKQERNRGLSSGKNDGRSAGKQELLDDLNLSADQQVKWDAIHENYREKMKVIKSDESISEEERKEMGRSMRGEMKAEVMAILNSEQQATLAKHEEERNKNRQKNAKENGR